jgi:hypothetical protein
VTGQQREIIRRCWHAGYADEEIADRARVTMAELDIYLNWWCDRGCPA